MSEALPFPRRAKLQSYNELALGLRSATDWPAVQACLVGWPERAAQHWWTRRANGEPCGLNDARFFMARAHGFASWVRFSRHVEALSYVESSTARFEAAADAIVGGRAAALRKLLRSDSKLVCARSTREHRSTLLHYVSANGIEGFRQKTPANIVAIARMLLDAGANVNAESDAYGGHSTTLLLTATSVHPEAAGVQFELMELLLECGATITAGIVNACLHNGRGPAAEWLAARGAELDLEGAAGVGRIELARAFLKRSTQRQRNDAFAWACQFGRTDVASLLLEKGVKITAKLRHHGQTGLHWAAYSGHPATVRMLLERGAPTDTRDDEFDGTPLDWALHGRKNAEVIELLKNAAVQTASLPPRRTAKL